MTHNIILIPY
jgi:hypothetical protein